MYKVILKNKIVFVSVLIVKGKSLGLYSNF